MRSSLRLVFPSNWLAFICAPCQPYQWQTLAKLVNDRLAFVLGVVLYFCTSVFLYFCTSVFLYFCISVFLYFCIHLCLCINGRLAPDWSMIDWHSFLMDGHWPALHCNFGSFWTGLRIKDQGSGLVEDRLAPILGKGSPSLITGSRIKDQDWSMDEWQWFLMEVVPSSIMIPIKGLRIRITPFSLLKCLLLGMLEAWARFCNSFSTFCKGSSLKQKTGYYYAKTTNIADK